MNIIVKPGPESDKKYLKISSWSVTKFSGLNMMIQLNFEEPLRISNSLGVRLQIS